MFQAAAIQVVKNHWDSINRSLSPLLSLSVSPCFSRPCLFSTVLLPLYALHQSHVVKDTYSDKCTSDSVTHVFWLLSSFGWVLWSQREGGNPAGLDACDWLPGVVMSFHCTSATLRMTCSDGVLRVGVKAIKTQPSVKLALVVHEVKTILLSNVTKSPHSFSSFVC